MVDGQVGKPLTHNFDYPRWDKSKCQNYAAKDGKVKEPFIALCFDIILLKAARYLHAAQGFVFTLKVLCNSKLANILCRASESSVKEIQTVR